MKKFFKFLDSEIDPVFAQRARLILDEIEKRKPKKILDAGCGRGFYLKCLSFFSFLKEIHGVDINDFYLQIAKKNNTDKRIKIKKASIDRLPYKNKYFDLIICSEVLEHLKNDRAALLELKRVLKPNGVILVTVPNKQFPFFWDPINWVLMKFFNTHIDKNIWWLAGIWADHERLYTTNELKNLVKNTQLKVIEIKKLIHWSWPFSHFLLYGIGKNLVEKFNLKLFNRFEFDKKNILSKLLANFFSLPPRLFDKKFPQKNSVNIYLVLIRN